LLPILVPVLVVSVLALVAVTYHVPYFAIGPGPSREVDTAIQLAPKHVFPTNGRGKFLLMSVSIRDVTVFEAVRGWLDSDVDVVKVRDVIGTEPTEDPVV